MEPQLQILIVEDNPGDVLIVTELMRSSGINFKMTHASTLRETLSLCLENDFDIILLDLGLPDSVGLETLKKIQVFRIKSPVVVMTGLDDEYIALASMREGAQDYLVKNRLTADTVLRTIKYSIERKKIFDLQKKHVLQFSVLSASSTQLNECEDISSSLNIICENLRTLLEKAGVIAIEFLDPLTVRVSGIEWLGPWIQKIKLLTGWDMNRSVFGNIHVRKDLLDSVSDCKLHMIEGGIYEIFDRTIDQDNCAELMKLLSVNYVYAIGFFRFKIFFGGFLIFSHKLIEDDDIKIIEAIGNQISLSMHRKSIEKDLRLSEFRYKKLSTRLEQKVIERTRDLESANYQLHQELTERALVEEALRKNEVQLKELNATKDKFFNIIAHDLKNPFTSLLGSTELLYQNINKIDNEKIKELAVILNDSAKGGYAILLNLLDWSRSQTGLLKFNPEWINLTDLINENISNLMFLAANKEIKLCSEAGEDIFITSDANMINTLLRNLLSNSLKFTRRGGEVTVRTFVNPDEVIVSVKDNGIGISQENIEKLFRIDTKYSMPGTENEQGTGLGLKLSKEFVEKLGGKIWVESIENKGSEFKFSIPLNKKDPLNL
jgi:signal transduction histidine kinase/DNA-binding NarL/FixJ family response regulator